MMTEQDDDVAAALASRPQEKVPADFVARVSARIDAEERSGWSGIADFRLWTLRLAPATAAIAVIALAWPTAATTDTPASTDVVAVQAESFAPGSVDDWQAEVSADALLDAALQPPKGASSVR